jgi:hypothetical protein
MTSENLDASPRHFPADWPPGCPPSGAVDAAGIVHRIVKNQPPQEDELKSHAELGLAPGAPPCARLAISVFTSREGACHRLRLSPHLGTMVASAALSAEHGRLGTPNAKSGHREWWPYAGVVRHALFSGASACP